MAPAPDSYDVWARANKYAGYRYAVSSATLPASATPGSALPITVHWTNFGTAPSYDNWQVVYELRNSDNNVVTTLRSALSLLTSLPSKTTPTLRKIQQVGTSDTFSLPTSGLSAGSYGSSRSPLERAQVTWKRHRQLPADDTCPGRTRQRR